MTKYCHPYYIPPLILIFVSVFTEETKAKNISPDKGTTEIATPTTAIVTSTPEVGGATTDTKEVEEEEESDEDIL